jgi:hypothetical protein
MLEIDLQQMVFEITVLGSTCWNAIDRPRNSSQPLARTLRHDGILLFAYVNSDVARTCLAQDH